MANVLSRQKIKPLFIGFGNQANEYAKVLSFLKIQISAVCVRNLNKDEGMIFFWPDADKRCMWMKNTPIKLSIAFINSNQMIAEIRDLDPYSTESVCSRSNDIVSAIEMNRDWFVENNIRIFSKVYIP